MAAKDTFVTIRTEGALLPSDFLQRLGDPRSGLPGLNPEAYHLPAGEKLSEAASRAWNRLVPAWAAFQSATASLGATDPATTPTRERWLLPLFDNLGYGRLPTSRAVELDGKTYPVSHAWGCVPIHLVGRTVDLDRRSPGVAGAATASPHGLVQQFLNHSDAHLWGVLSNGMKLRLLRDNRSLTRLAYVEFDLAAMMDGQAYSDFVVLFLLLHVSRVEGERPEECWLERWSRDAQQDGTRALAKLRAGVEQAIAALGQGFLSSTGNPDLRQRLSSGALDRQNYYRQLLRLVYRLLFLFVAEDRGLLHSKDAPEAAVTRYRLFYSTRRLRDLARQRRGSAHGDLWESLLLVMGRLGAGQGCPELGLPALGSFLWRDEALPDLAHGRLANADLLSAVRSLAFTSDRHGYRPVDFRNLGPEELGSVYEALLELHPRVEPDGGAFSLETAAGNERKTTGSYYTPTSLISCLLDSALDPVLDEACRKPDPAAAILDLKVVDPACGSGHFLIAAAHRMASRLAAVRTGEAEPSPEAVRTALRDVIGRCIHGVDINPMAAELCKINLWLDALDPGRPLSFLDHHIQVGNALIGATPALLRAGVPDEAFDPIEGDEKDVARSLKKQNRAERGKQTTLFAAFAAGAVEAAARLHARAADVDAQAEDTVAAVEAKADAWEALVGSAECRRARLAADAWCAAFVWPKTKAMAGVPAPSHEMIRLVLSDAAAIPEPTRREVERLAGEYGFFHWHLAFPGVFSAEATAGEAVEAKGGPDWTGGFDVVLGNPPWGRLEVQEKEFFASICPDIAAARSKDRKALLEALKSEMPDLFLRWLGACRLGEGQSQFVRFSNCYPRAGSGNVNTFALFAELAATRIQRGGRVGLVVPSGVMTEASSEALFRWWVDEGRIVRGLDFENSEALFPDIHRSARFCLLTLCWQGSGPEKVAFSFFLRRVTDVSDSEKSLSLGSEELRILNPESLTCPPMPCRRDARLLLWVHRRFGVFASANPAAPGAWGAESRQMLNSSHDSGSFVELSAEHAGRMDSYGIVVNDAGALVRLYDGKMIDQFDHRLASTGHKTSSVFRTTSSDRSSLEDYASAEFLVTPQYWVPLSKVAALVPDYCLRRGWWIAFRAITAVTNWRTVISCVVPLSGQVHALPALYCPLSAAANAALVACLNSFALDYCARLKLGGTHLSHFALRQLPAVPPAVLEAAVSWSEGAGAVQNWLVPRVLELSYTASDLQRFAHDLGWDCPPFRWDLDRRFKLRCELDAAFFHLYGMARDDVDYIMDTFPIIREKDEKRHGDYRTKLQVLAIYDAMQTAIDTGVPYRTILDPPPADPCVAHAGPRSPDGARA